MRNKAETVAVLLAITFIAAALLYPLPAADSVQTERYAPQERVLTGGDPDEEVDELMPGELVDINTADANRLRLLPGIGDVTAEKIIDFRRENGGFDCIEDIMNVSGIGEKKFEQLKELITVGKEK